MATPVVTTAALTTFTCAPVGCYSLNNKTTHEIFKDLQGYLNRFARAVQAPLIGVDGIIGSGTVTLAQKTAAAMARSGASPTVVGMAAAITPVASSRESLARGAADFLNFLKLAATEAQLPAVAAPKPGSSITAPVVALETLPGAFVAKKPHILYYVAGGLAGLVVLWGGYHVLTKGSTAVAGARPDPWWSHGGSPGTQPESKPYSEMTKAEKARFRAEQRAWEAEEERIRQRQARIDYEDSSDY